MAAGDDAAAAGMATVPGTTLANTIDTEINITRDYIAQRTSAVQPIAKGGTGATTAPAARTALGITPANIGASAPGHTHTINDIYTSDGSAPYGPALQGVLDAMNANIATKVGKWEAWGGPFQCYDSRIRGITSDYASIYADGSGLFGIPASSRTQKTDLAEWNDDDCTRFLELVGYWGHYRTDDSDAPLRPFFILEEFDDAGFGAFVIRDRNGRGIGLHYELVTVAQQAIARRHAARLEAVEARLAKLEEAAS